MTENDLERRIAALESLVDEHARTLADRSGRGVSRRSVLQALGVVGLGGYAAGTASADPQGQLGTQTDPLRTVHTEALNGGLTGDAEISDLLGPGLVAADGSLRTSVTGATSRGTGADVFTGNDDGLLGFRSLVAGNSLSIRAGAEELIFDVDDDTINNDATNRGNGIGLYTDRSGRTLRFRSLVGGSNVSLSASGSEVRIDASSGEANTASNVGSGAGLFKGKSGVDLEFRSLTTSGALSATETADTVALASAWADADADSLLEPRSGTGYTGIDLTGISGARVVTPWVGTTDATAFEAFVAGTRTARFGTTGTDQDGNAAAGNVLLGQYARVADGATGASVGGGGSAVGTEQNVVADNYGTIAGGQDNLAGNENADPETADHATVGGGRGNVAGARYGTIAGGSNNSVNAESGTVGGGYGQVVNGQNGTIAGGTVNQATSTNATVAGGNSNVASGEASVICGGYNNTASGQKAMILGGRDSVASGRLSLTAGYKAKTETAGGTTHSGAFVWGDSTNTVVRSTAADEVRFQASGGFAIQDGDLAIEDGNAITDASGNAHLQINDGGPLGVGRALDLSDNDLVDGGTTVWDTAAGYVPQGRLENDALTVTAGTGLTGGGSVALGASTTLDVDLDSIAGENVTVDTTNNELDVTNASANMVESDADGLLEPVSPYTGVDATTVKADEIQGAGGFTHLTLTSGGPLSVNQPLQMNGQPIRSDPGVGLTFQTDAGKRTLVLGIPQTETNGNLAGGNVVAGSASNAVTTGKGIVIGGGGADGGNENSVDGNFTTVAGGWQNTAGGSEATVGGGTGNTTGAQYAVASGGYQNSASGKQAVIGGGYQNDTSATSGTIGGGYQNTVSGTNATVAGGISNSASGNAATVGGGNGNSAAGIQATIPGGATNTASGDYSLAAGRDSSAAGNYSLAAGRSAKAETVGNTGHSGAFVWGDGTTTVARSQADNQFVVQASKGVYVGDDGGPGGDFYTNDGRLIETSSGAYLTTGGVWTDNSSRTVKENVTPVDGPSMLEAVESLSINEWSYETESDVRHVGPMAEDFADTFGLGNDDEHIASLDTAGVALAAIQGLTERLSEKDDRIDELETTAKQRAERIDDLEDDRDELEAEVDAKDERIDELEERLERVESALDLGDGSSRA